MDGNLRFKIDWASLIVWSIFTISALFYFVFEGNFPSTSHWGAYIWRGDLTEVFCVTGLEGLYLEGLIHGGACFWNFMVCAMMCLLKKQFFVIFWSRWWEIWNALWVIHKVCWGPKTRISMLLSQTLLSGTRLHLQRRQSEAWCTTIHVKMS